MSWSVIRPIGYRVLVKLHERRAMYGVLEIPDDFRKQPETGEVIAKGDRVSDELKPGTIVVMGKFNGTELPNPEWDPHAEPGRYRMCDVDLVKRGDKLAVPVQGYTHLPWITDVYGVVEFEGESMKELLEATATDMPKRRSA